MKNKEIADKFETMADIMEIKGENAFRIRSYRKVTEVLEGLGEDVAEIAHQRGVETVPGIGKSSAQKINEYLETGKISAHEKLLNSFPVSALDMLQIPDVGPKTIAKLINEKGITSVDELERTIDNGKLGNMEGIGDKMIEKIKTGISFVKSCRGRILLGEALPTARNIIQKLREETGAECIEFAGSLRRMRETVGDVDILAGLPPEAKVNEDGQNIVSAFTQLEMAGEVLAAGDTKGSIRTKEGLQVDMRVVPLESFGAALLYFTGSRAHNVKLRGMAADRGLKINEYGLYRGDTKLAGASEKDIYGALDLSYIAPELREDRGEVEAAAERSLPDLIATDDIKGEMHSHCTFSDGDMTVEEMAYAAKASGYEYLAITDHSKSLTIANGLDEDDLKRKNEIIDRINNDFDYFYVLKGTEVDILKDGSLDYGDETLSELDWVIASVHDHFAMREREMTDRIAAAVRNPHVDCIGHLTGRLLNRREAYPVNRGKIIDECAQNRTALELNAYPERLDITDIVCREAKKAGVKISIGCDAHTASHFSLIKFGIATARRGWLESKDVLNTMSKADLLNYLG